MKPENYDTTRDKAKALVDKVFEENNLIHEHSQSRAKRSGLVGFYNTPRELAMGMIDSYISSGEASGKSYKTLAGSAVYGSLLIFNMRKTQEDISELCDTSPLSMSGVYDEMVEQVMIVH